MNKLTLVDKLDRWWRAFHGCTQHRGSWSHGRICPWMVRIHATHLHSKLEKVRLTDWKEQQWLSKLQSMGVFDQLIVPYNFCSKYQETLASHNTLKEQEHHRNESKLRCSCQVYRYDLIWAYLIFTTTLKLTLSSISQSSRGNSIGGMQAIQRVTQNNS